MSLENNQRSNINRNKLLNRYFIVVTIAILFGFPILLKGNPFVGDIVIMSFLYASLASAWNLTGGFAGQVSIGHTAFFGVGAYTSSILLTKLGVSPWIGLIIGGILAVGLAIFIGIPCFRLKSHFFVIATISLAEVLRRIFSYFSSITGGGKGLLISFHEGWKFLMFSSKIQYIYITLILMLASILISYYVKNNKLGYYLVSLRENQDAAESLGINTSRCKLISFMISAFITAICGSIYAQYLFYIDPTTVFNLSLSTQLVLFSIIGGLGTIFGPILGALLLTPLDVYLRDWFGGMIGFNFIVYGLILMISVIYFPKGLTHFFSLFHHHLSKKNAQDRNEVKTLYEGEWMAGSENRESLSLIINKDQDDYFNHHLEDEKNILEIKELCKNFKGLEAIKSLDLDIKKGEIVGLIGPNGAGKTTLFNLITGFIPPDHGIIRYKGREITNVYPPHKICQERIARTFQIVKPFGNMTVLENIMVGGFIASNNVSEVRNEAKSIVKFVGLENKQESLASSLPIADRKRLELARALATHPHLILLDETMAGLTSTETQKIITLVKEINDCGITLLIIEHVMKAIMALSNKIVVLHHGQKIAEGKPEQISKNKEVIDAYLGEAYNA